MQCGLSMQGLLVQLLRCQDPELGHGFVNTAENWNPTHGQALQLQKLPAQEAAAWSAGALLTSAPGTIIIVPRKRFIPCLPEDQTTEMLGSEH